MLIGSGKTKPSNCDDHGAGSGKQPVAAPRLPRANTGTTTIALLSSFVIVAAGVIGINQLLHLRNVVQVTLARQGKAQRVGTDILVQALQCRRYEKDFFLNITDPKIRSNYLTKWEEAWGRMSADIDQLAQTSADLHSVKDIEIEERRRDVENYRQLFLDIVSRTQSGEIRDAAHGNEVIKPFKGYARRIITSAQALKMASEELLAKQSDVLREQLTRTLLLTLFLMVVPAALIVIGQVLFNRQMASAKKKLQDQNNLLASQEAETKKLALVASHTDSAVIICDQDHRIEWVNQSFTRITELTFDNVVGQTIDQAFAFNKDRMEEFRLVREHLEQGQPLHIELAGETPSGRHYWLAADIQPIQDHEGRVINFVAVQRDITRQKHAESLLREAARTDKLTSLPNRTEIYDRIGQAIDRNKANPDSDFSVLFLDFDRFKIINDSLGHDVGDLLLIEIGKRLQSFIQTQNSAFPWCAARIGGDEFVLLMDGVESLDMARGYASDLLDIFSDPYFLAGNEVRSSASIGIVLGDSQYERAEDVIRDADIAMYQAKMSGKACAVPFDRAMHNKVRARQKLEADLHYAMKRDELTLEYQPIVSLDTGGLIGFEALLRWDHDSLGRLIPSDFLDIAEETGLIKPIGNWVINLACLQISEWRRTFPDTSYTMNINLSRNQLMHPGLIGEIKEAMEISGVDPTWLHFEITENSIMRDMEAVRGVLEELKSMGCKIVMDDFGAGQSSLHYLQELPLDTLKMDQVFISNMESNVEYTAIIQSIATLTHNMGINLVAEGVETSEQVAQLQSLECGQAQGFIFSPPLPPGACTDYIRRSIGDTGITYRKRPA